MYRKITVEELIEIVLDQDVSAPTTSRRTSQETECQPNRASLLPDEGHKCKYLQLYFSLTFKL